MRRRRWKAASAAARHGVPSASRRSMPAPTFSQPQPQPHSCRARVRSALRYSATRRLGRSGSNDGTSSER